ncbi:BRO family protein [Deinococcus sp.]|uniref:BRO family protein n=1 Tax=Deinococcus sp. TaxID=47478 RepID=UPI0025FCBFD3|nr:BRO family protein [Deinococcus sp.]
MLAPINPFDAICRTAEGGAEYWSARDLMPLLGYDTWRKFAQSIERAAAACDNSGQDSKDHFVPSGKLIETGKGAEREVLDYRLSRYACYLTAMNSDARKAAVAGAQTYFAAQTRHAELAQAAPVLPPASPLALSRLMLEALENTDARVSAIEARLDASPIDSKQVGIIYKLGQSLGEAMGNYAQAWRLFKNRFGLASYRDLPTHQFEDGAQFLRMQLAIYTGKPLLEVTQ